jgi:ribose 5-phosphate isomerase A
MNFKQQAAATAITFIKDDSIVGLGAGSTIAYTIDYLKTKINDGLSIQLVTSSFTTKQLLLKENLAVLPIEFCKEIDIYFDGCDQFDKQLNALKSGGGIHTQEKLLASMAKQFILAGDDSKLVDTFDTKYPLVIEMLPQSATFVPYKIQTLFPGVKIQMRINDKKDGAVITENGNYLLDVYFEQWPALSSINQTFKNIAGVVETSLFYGMTHKAIIAGENGVTVLDKNQ